MASPVLGIDLGTTNSVVAYCDGGVPRVLRDSDGDAVTPSVVSFHPSGQVLAGQGARDRRMVDAASTIFSIKRLIGRPFRSAEVQRAAERLPFPLLESPTGGAMVAVRGETYTLPEISALVLRRLRSIAEQALGQTCVNAVVTVPANFNELQRTATRDAGRIAGLNVVRILNEPTAAALAYGYQAGTRERVAIYDLGGGTFDISILDLSGDVIEVVASAGDSYLGGDDIDWAIADRMVEHFLEEERVDLGADAQAYERLRMAAEWLKCELSIRDHAVARVEDVAYSRDGSPVDLEYQMHQAELDELTFPLVGRTFDICETALRSAGLRPTQVDNVILVGGQTRSPKVRELVGDYFGRPPLSDVDPSFVVAEGAAVQGYVLGGESFEARTSPESSLPPALSMPPPDEHEQPTRVAPAPPRMPAESFDDEPTTVRPSTPAGIRGKPVGAVTLRSMTSGPPPPPKRVTAPPPVPADARRPRPSAPARPSSPAAPPSIAPEPPSGIDVAPSLAPAGSDSLPPISSHPLAAAAPVDQTLVEAPKLSFEDAAAAWQDRPSQRPPAAPTLRSEPPPPSTPSASAAPAGTASASAPAATRSAPAPASAAPVQPTVPPASKRKVPLLLDVTPQALGIETAGGYCEQIIEQNAPIPTEQTRRFSTSQDDQTEVQVRVCQGEERRVEDNQELGVVRLTRLRAAPRGEVKIDVTFMIDADGTLDVRARDEATGKAQKTRIDLVGALSDSEVRRMRERLSGMDVD